MYQGKWRDWTKPLPPTFEGQPREEILATWEEHFGKMGIPTRRITGKRKSVHGAGKYCYWRTWIKLQIRRGQKRAGGEGVNGPESDPLFRACLECPYSDCHYDDSNLHRCGFRIWWGHEHGVDPGYLAGPRGGKHRGGKHESGGAGQGIGGRERGAKDPEKGDR